MMFYTQNYISPLGEMLLAADEIGLVGLWFMGQKYFGRGLGKPLEERMTPPLAQAKAWLDLYFSGGIPAISPPLHLIGTPFQLSVWQRLLQIPYGQTVTYGQIAEKIAIQKGSASMSAQAVGGAVGHNPISLIVPCHRVLGSKGELTGYAGGVHRKEALLKLEQKN